MIYEGAGYTPKANTKNTGIPTHQAKLAIV